MTQLEQMLQHGLAGFPGSAAIASTIKAAFAHLEARVRELETKAGITTSFEAQPDAAIRHGGPRSYADQVKDLSRPVRTELSGPTPAQIAEAEAYIRLRGYSEEAAKALVAQQGAEAVLAAMRVEEAIADPSRIAIQATHTQ